MVLCKPITYIQKYYAVAVVNNTSMLMFRYCMFCPVLLSKEKTLKRGKTITPLPDLLLPFCHQVPADQQFLPPSPHDGNARSTNQWLQWWPASASNWLRDISCVSRREQAGAMLVAYWEGAIFLFIFLPTLQSRNISLTQSIVILCQWYNIGLQVNADRWATSVCTIWLTVCVNKWLVAIANSIKSNGAELFHCIK